MIATLARAPRPPRRGGRSGSASELRRAAGFQPVPVAEHLALRAISPRSRCACPSCPASSPLRAFARYYPEGAAVGHLVGYVGTPNREDYEAENRNPLLITPGFKVGKEGLEKVMEQRLRGRPGAARVEVTARGRLVRELHDPARRQRRRRCARRSTPACRAMRRAGSARNRAPA